MRILYHDDFDGVASAAILGAWRKKRRPDESLTFISVDYGHTDLQWDQERPKGLDDSEPIAIVDFMFHPAAAIYVDHHATAFKTPEHEALFRQRFRNTQSMDAPHYWNPTAPSCAAALAEILPHFTPQFEALIHAATRIDQAQYDSVADYLEMRTPAIAISHAIPLMSEGEKGELIRRLMTTGDLEVGAAFAAPAIELAKQRIREGLSVTEAATLCLGDVAITDMVMMDAPWIRFAAYAVYPKAKYSFTIYRTGTTVRIALGKNPWLEFDPQHLGNFASQAGGGGHAYAAGCQFEGEDAYVQAWRFIRQTCTTVNA